MLEQQQSDGVNVRGLAIHPLPVDPANGNFRLKPDSPALNSAV